jgi:hypothetical protein
MFSGLERRGQIEYMGNAIGRILAAFPVIHPNAGDCVRPFQQQGDALVLPTGRHHDVPAVPGHPDVMPVRGQKEGKLYPTFLPVFCKSRIVVERAVVQTARPLGFQSGNVSTEVFGHGSGQFHGIGKFRLEPTCPDTFVLSVHLKLPGTGQRDGLCTICPIVWGQMEQEYEKEWQYRLFHR